MNSYGRVYAHVAATSVIATAIVLDSTGNLEREDSLTGVVWVREINPLKIRMSLHDFHR